MYYSGKRFFKVFNAANFRNGYEYETGINDLSSLIGTDGNPMKCYFTDIEHIFCYLNYGPCFREITIPDSTPIIIENGEKFQISSSYIPGWYTDKVILGDIKLWSVDSVKYLIELGADISVENYYIVQWSLMYNFEIFYYLQEYICKLDENLWTEIVVDLQNRGYL